MAHLKIRLRAVPVRDVFLQSPDWPPVKCVLRVLPPVMEAAGA